MATCKDCINSDKCPTALACSGNPICSMFKDKSRFIELPCKVGDTVYVIDIIDSEYDEFLIGPCIVNCIILFDDKIQIKCKETHNNILTFGKDVFLTQEDAEKALKEQGEIDR